MTVRRMTEEWRRLRTLDRDSIGRLLLVALAAEEYCLRFCETGEAPLYPLEFAVKVANGVSEAPRELLGGKTLDEARLAEIAYKELER